MSKVLVISFVKRKLSGPCLDGILKQTRDSLTELGAAAAIKLGESAHIAGESIRDYWLELERLNKDISDRRDRMLIGDKYPTGGFVPGGLVLGGFFPGGTFPSGSKSEDIIKPRKKKIPRRVRDVRDGDPKIVTPIRSIGNLSMGCSYKVRRIISEKGNDQDIYVVKCYKGIDHELKEDDIARLTDSFFVKVTNSIWARHRNMRKHKYHVSSARDPSGMPIYELINDLGEVIKATGHVCEIQVMREVTPF